MQINLAEEVYLESSDLRDLPELRKVCLQTGNAGNDATEIYNNPDLLGEIYVEPYVRFQPNFAFTLKAHDQISGYVLGALQTKAFEIMIENNYRPNLLEKYQLDAELATADRVLLDNYRDFLRTPDEIVDEYPAHLHIDLLPSVQGRNFGKMMMKVQLRALFDAGATGVHLRVARENHRAINFYSKLGFTNLMTMDSEFVFGYLLGPNSSMFS